MSNELDARSGRQTTPVQREKIRRMLLRSRIRISRLASASNAIGTIRRLASRSNNNDNGAVGATLLHDLRGALPSSFHNMLADAESLPPVQQQVFCNREIRMDRVKVIGFDYDYTLASYKSTLQKLVYQLAQEYMIKRLRFPATLAERQYDPAFAIRGLVFDRQHGVLLKLSYAYAISPDAAYIGRQLMSAEGLREMYGEALQVDPTYVKQHMKPLNDLFALAEACLLADAVQLALESGTAVDAAAVGADVSKAIEWVHLSGVMHDTVAASPEEYLHPSQRLGSLLGAARDSGKSLFVLTNSGFDFVDRGMRFLIGPEWRQLFDLVIVSAQKPAFYTRDSPFRAISERGFVTWRAAEAKDLEKGRVLIGGSLAELGRLTGWGGIGKQVLYVGDHVHTDLRAPRRKAGWATAAILRELEHELAVMALPEFTQLVERAIAVEELLHRVPKLGLPAGDVVSTLDVLEAERARIQLAVSASFNAQFGSVFRHRSDSTAYAFAVKQHVDLYTARLEHLLTCGAKRNRFYPTRCKLLPHDPEITMKWAPPPTPSTAGV